MAEQRPGSMGIGESHPLGGESVDVRCGDLGAGVVAAGVALAHVIDENDDDMRESGGRCRGCDERAEPGKKREKQRAKPLHERIRDGPEEFTFTTCHFLPTKKRLKNAIHSVVDNRLKTCFFFSKSSLL